MLINTSQNCRLAIQTILSHSGLLQDVSQLNVCAKRWLWAYKPTIGSSCYNKNRIQGQCQQRDFTKGMSLNQSHPTETHLQK